jgi:hypothetical protein
MASGLWSLLLTEEGTWESFPSFANAYAKQVGARVLRRASGPDIHVWEIKLEESIVLLVYDDFPNGVSVVPRDEQSQDIVDKLYRRALDERDISGL